MEALASREIPPAPTPPLGWAGSPRRPTTRTGLYASGREILVRMPYGFALKIWSERAFLHRVRIINCIHPVIYLHLAEHQPRHRWARSSGGSGDLLSLPPASPRLSLQVTALPAGSRSPRPRCAPRARHVATRTLRAQNCCQRWPPSPQSWSPPCTSRGRQRVARAHTGHTPPVFTARACHCVTDLLKY